MKNISLTIFLLSFLLFSGCITENSKPTMKIKDKKGKDNTELNVSSTPNASASQNSPASPSAPALPNAPTSPNVPPPTTIYSETLASLAAEQVVKLNTATCGYGYELKNPNLINEHFIKAKDVLNKNSCLSCHNASAKTYANLNYSSTQELLDKKGVSNSSYLINPSEIQKSSILNKLANYGGSMPAVSKSDLNILKEWVKSIDYECLTEKEIVKQENKQIKTADATIDNNLTTYSSSKSTRSTSILKVLIPEKVELNLTISESGTNTITAESIDSIKNLTKETSKIKFKTNATYVASVKNKILKLEESILITSFDGLVFKSNQTYNLNLTTGVIAKDVITLSDLPPMKQKEINKIQTTVTTTGQNKNGITTIIQKTKTLSTSDNSFAIKDRTYLIDSNQLSYTEVISDFGPKSTISSANGIKTDIAITAYLKDGKTYIEKKIIKTLPDGTIVDGIGSGTTIVGSNLTTSIIDGDLFTFTITPIIGEKVEIPAPVETTPAPLVRSSKVRPTRTCDINSLEKSINDKSSTPSGTWIPHKNMNILFGDRFYVQSVLKKVFGEITNREHYDINYLNNIFGGSFDEFDVVRSDKDYYTVINTTPEGYNFEVDNQLLMSETIGPLSPVRVAISVRICEDITKSDAYILKAIKNIINDQSITASNIPYPLDQDFSAAHSLFYPFALNSENTVKALACVANTQDSALNQWRYVLLAICTTTEWQIP